MKDPIVTMEDRIRIPYPYPCPTRWTRVLLLKWRVWVTARNHLLFQDADGGTMTNSPECIIVWLVHFLAHDEGFPSEYCRDEDHYAEFCSPLIMFLQALVNLDDATSCNKDASTTLAYFLGIFRAIMKAEDAVDANFTPSEVPDSEVCVRPQENITHVDIVMDKPNDIPLERKACSLTCKSKGQNGTIQKQGKLMMWNKRKLALKQNT